MREVKLVLPQRKYMASYAVACREFLESGRGHTLGGQILNDLAWQDDLLAKFKRARLGLHGEPEMVPATTYWLVAGDEYIGTGRLRHRLKEHLLTYGGHIGYSIRPAQRGRGYGTLQLKLLLEQARLREIATALITCDDNNAASYRVIEKNGGLLRDIVMVRFDEKEHVVRRYTVDI